MTLPRLTHFLAAAILIGTTYDSRAADQPDIELRDITFRTQNGEETDAELGRFNVPENRSDPNSRKLELSFIRFPTTSANPGPPIVYLAGGPGGSGIATAKGDRFPFFMAMREIADVIAFDQRGTGNAQFAMTYMSNLSFPLDKPSNKQEMLAEYLEEAKDAMEYFRGKGIDLNGYTTVESADDVETLRRALGVEKITLWGTSYGTHLALATLKRHGEHIHKAVLMGTEGLNQSYKLPGDTQRQLEMIAEEIEADPELSTHIPNLLGAIESLLKQLEKQPVTVALTSDAGERTDVVVGTFDLRMYLSGLVGRRGGIERLPAAVHAMTEGDFTALGEFARSFRRLPGFNGMALVMDSVSGATQERYERIEREARETLLGNAISFPFPEVREGVDVPDLGDDFRAPVETDVPTLFVSGELDGRTPVGNAEKVRENFSNSHHLIVENIGHGDDLFMASPKILDLTLKFLRGESIETDRIEMPAIAFEPIEED